MSNAEKTTYPYRSEILFLYDIFRCNPNGDPFENRPRQDPATGRIDVTDVRLKRTIRDYIDRFKRADAKENIFVRVAGDRAVTAERRYEELFKKLPTPDKRDEAKKNLTDQCVDVRLFGGLVPITRKEKSNRGEKPKTEEDKKEPETSGEGAGIQLTGAVQFNAGQSLHAVDVVEISGTGGFASKETAKQKTFRKEFFVPYALIGFYGVINERVATETGLTTNDVDVLMEAIWNGTLFLHSRSKAFHHPRLLLRFDFNNQQQCGYLLDKIAFNPNNGIEEKKIRSARDYSLKLDNLMSEIEKRKNALARVFCQCDDSDLFKVTSVQAELLRLIEKGKLTIFPNQEQQ